MRYWRWMWTYIKRIKYGFLLALVLLAAESLSNILVVYLQRFLIDDVFIAGQYGELTKIVLWMALAFVLQTILFTATPSTFIRNEYLMNRKVLEDMLKAIRSMPVGKFQTERTARFVQYLTGDIHQTCSIVGFQIPRVVQEALTIAVLLIIIGFASPYLLLTAAGVTAVYLTIGRRVGPMLKRAAKEYHASRTDLFVHLEEGVSATREVLSFHRHRWERAIYDKLFARYFDRAMKQAKTENLGLVLSEPLRSLVLIATLGIGGYQMINQTLSVGTFVVVFQLIQQLMESIGNLFNFMMSITSQLANIDRLNLVLQEERAEDGDERLDAPVRSIRLDRVRFRYGDELAPVLKGVTLDIPIGKKSAFVGASGGGKSTIAQLLIRFYDPTEGRIEVNGVPLNRIRRDEWAERIAIVFQEPYLMAETIRSNIMLGRDELGEASMIDACRRAQIHDVFAALPNGYDTEIGERGITLSGGQRQRLAMARAMIVDPEILVLDEATSSLDLETERVLQAELDAVRAGRTTIVIAHRLSTVRNADVIFVMENGAVAEQGTHEQLMKSGSVYPRLVAAEQAEHAGKAG